MGQLQGIKYAFDASGAPAGMQGSLNYQIAALLAARDTIASSKFFGTDVNTIPTVPKFADAFGRDRIPNMIEVVGSDAGNLGPSWVSNSGIHYGTRQEIYIEDQPLFRGTYSLLTDLGKLVSNPSENDFADTHSLVLLQDSLSLMATLESLDPGIDIETARRIYASVSGAQATAVLGSQGVAEGDVLERTLDALRTIFFGPDVEPTLDYAETLAGNTWHLSSLRLPFHERLQELNDRVAELSSGPSFAPRFVVLSNKSSNELQALAASRGEEGFAYRYALRELNPFALLGVGYGQHNVDGSLELDGTSAGALSGMTAEYLADRSAMLAWKTLDYASNGKAVLRSPDGTIYKYTDYELLDADGGELSFVVHGVRAGSVGEPAFISFGSDQDDTLTGGNLSVGDRLYGAEGDDTIEGRAGADYLEGNSGDDTLKGGADDDMLVGGAGFDSYVYNEGDGFDTVTDSDGLGRIVYNGRSLGGGAKIGENVYKDVFAVDLIVLDDDIDGQSLLIDGSILVENFKDGDLGIHLEGHVDLPARPQGVGAHVYVDSVHPQDFDPADDDQFSFLRDLYGSREDDSFLTSGQIAIFGRAGNDTALVGEDAVYAVPIDLGSGDDLIDAGTSSGASGAGRISGGGGNDYIVGSPGDDIVWGDNYLAISEFVTSDGAPRSLGAYRIDGVIYNAELPPGEGLFGPLPPGYGIFSVIVEDVQLYDATDQASADAVLVPDGSMIAGTLEHLISVVVGASATFDDYIEAGEGNDHVTGGSGADDIFGGVGDDVLVGDYGAGSIRLPSYAALKKGFGELAPLFGLPGDDYIDGGDGDDTLTDTDGGNDILVGGDGNDVIESREDFWTAESGPGAINSIQGEAGDDVITVLNASGGFEFIDAGDGDDYIEVRASHEALGGVRSGIGRAFVFGGSGDDLLRVFSDDGIVEGGAGDDDYVILGGRITISDSSGHDTLHLGVFDLSFVDSSLEAFPVLDPEDQAELDAADQFESTVVVREGGDLLVNSRFASDGGAVRLDQIRIAGWFEDEENRIERIASTISGDFFLTAAQLENWGGFHQGGGGADELVYSSSYSDRALGFGGDDLISTGAGADRISGGPGNDEL